MSVIQMKEAQFLYDILAEEYALLTSITEIQKKIRDAVVSRNWTDLQNAILELEKNTESFNKVEHEREVSFQCFSSDKSDNIYNLTKKLPKTYKKTIPELYHQIRRLLISSKIENQSINEYVKITKNFLDEVFDNVIPQRRNVVYSNNGTILRRQPESILLNTIM